MLLLPSSFGSAAGTAPGLALLCCTSAVAITSDGSMTASCCRAVRSACGAGAGSATKRLMVARERELERRDSAPAAPLALAPASGPNGSCDAAAKSKAVPVAEADWTARCPEAAAESPTWSASEPLSGCSTNSSAWIGGMGGVCCCKSASMQPAASGQAPEATAQEDEDTKWVEKVDAHHSVSAACVLPSFWNIRALL